MKAACEVICCTGRNISDRLPLIPVAFHHTGYDLVKRSVSSAAHDQIIFTGIIFLNFLIRIIDLHPAGLGAELARQAALVQALRRGIPLTEEQKKQIAPARTDIIAVYRELQSRRWHAEDLQPLCAKLGEEQTGKTLVAVAALEQVGLITAAEKGGAKFWELVPTAGKKNLADAPILKCLEEL